MRRDTRKAAVSLPGNEHLIQMTVEAPNYSGR